MLRTDDNMTEITIVIPDEEMMAILGLDGDSEQLGAVRDFINWDALEEELGKLARKLLGSQAEGARARLAENDEALPLDGDDEAEGDLGGSSMSVWCRFEVTPKTGERRPWHSTLEIDDISPALDMIPVRMLPEWGEDWSRDDYGCARRLVAMARGIGLISDGDWEQVRFDGIDESAYEEYYDEKCHREGLPYVWR
jgi:hypothetical protein